MIGSVTLKTGNFHQRVVDAQSRERRHAVLHGFNGGVADLERGATGTFGHVGDQGRNVYRRVEVRADKDDSMIDRGRTNGDGRVLAQQQALAAHHRLRRQRVLPGRGRR